MSDERWDEAYLGDGLYASFDGHMITLRVAREERDHWVGLGPFAYKKLERFANECWPETRR